MNKFFLACTALFSALTLASSPTAAQSLPDNQTLAAPEPKILIAYYSYSGNTAAVAKVIQSEIGGDLFEIKSDTSYPDEYRLMTEQVKQQIQNGFRPQLTTSVADISAYDIVFIGSPNWWGTITPQVSSFLETYNLSGKKIIPFITSGGGSLQNTITDLNNQCKGCNVVTDAWSGYGSQTAGLSEWLEKLGLK